MRARLREAVPEQRLTLRPGTCSGWRCLPTRQAIIVISGEGRYQIEGGLEWSIRPREVVFFQPGEKHWFSASETTPVTFLCVGAEGDRMPR